MTSIFTIILIFGGAIFFHELGHYLIAKIFKQKIPEFAIGLGPTLFSYTDKNNTKWMLKLFPLGGYVKLPKLDSESKDICNPIERILIALAGPLGNFITAFVLATTLYIIGWEKPLDPNNVIGWSTPESIIQPGDKIIEVNNKKTNTWEEISWNVFLSTKKNKLNEPTSQFKVKKRKGGIKTYNIVTPIGGDFKIRQLKFSPTSSTTIDKIIPNSPAEIIGLQKNDKIISINGIKLYSNKMISTILHGNQDHKITVLRNKKTFKTKLYTKSAKITTTGKTAQLIGVYWNQEIKKIYPNPFKSIQKICKETFRGLGALINPKSDIGIKHMSSAPGIMKSIHKETKKGISYVLCTAILININLGILNLLPIPVLDGGHIALGIIEKIRKKRIIKKTRKVLERSCFVLLISLIFYISIQDIRFWNKGEDPNNKYYITPEF